MAQRSKKKWILIFAVIAVICTLVVIAPFLLRTFVVQAFKIPSGTMKPTLLVGDQSSLLRASPRHSGVKIAVLRKVRADLKYIWAAAHAKRYIFS